MLSNYQLNKIKSNLEYYYNQATPSERQSGISWYTAANEWCKDTALWFNFCPHTVAAVLSALSPRNKWEKNKIDTRTVLRAVVDGVEPENVKVSTFHKNKYKAFAIAQGEQRITVDSPKTYSFVRNIAYLDNDYVTCDVWHLRAAFKDMRAKKQLTKLEYWQLSEATKQVANKFGLQGWALQAIVWEKVRTTKK